MIAHGASAVSDAAAGAGAGGCGDERVRQITQQLTRPQVARAVCTVSCTSIYSDRDRYHPAGPPNSVCSASVKARVQIVCTRAPASAHLESGTPHERANGPIGARTLVVLFQRCQSPSIDSVCTHIPDPSPTWLGLAAWAAARPLISSACFALLHPRTS